MWRFIHRFAFLGLLSAAVLAIAGCDEDHRSNTNVESRELSELGEFQTINFTGVAELTVNVGKPVTVSIEGDEQAVGEIDTEVRDGVLYLRSKNHQWNWFSGAKNVRIAVSLPHLAVFESSGAGSVRINGLEGGDQRVSIAGAHNVRASGKLDRLEIVLNGAGNINYGDVIAQNVTVNVNGAGNVDVQPVQTLDAQVNGVGAVRYRGEPTKVHSAVHGLGAIERK